MEYRGRLISVDGYMNLQVCMGHCLGTWVVCAVGEQDIDKRPNRTVRLQLADTEEFIDGNSTGTLGEVLIRCVFDRWNARLVSDRRLTFLPPSKV